MAWLAAGSFGIASALAQARAAASDRAVVIAGGATTAQAFLRAGVVEELPLHLVSVLLGAGIRLFDSLGAGPGALERTHLVAAPGVTHLRYRIVQ